MTDDLLVSIVREALLLVGLVVSLPVAAALVVGLLVGIVQAVTQVQDQALSLAFRVCAVFGSLLAGGPWIFQQVSIFAGRVLELAVTT